MKEIWVKLDMFFSFFYLQHVDGSFSVKPLKQKQIVGSYFDVVSFGYLAHYQVIKLCSANCDCRIF